MDLLPHIKSHEIGKIYDNLNRKLRIHKLCLYKRQMIWKAFRFYFHYIVINQVIEIVCVAWAGKWFVIIARVAH